MMRGGRLSVVVPAYDEAEGIRQSLLAIANAARSTELPFELIVVDDGSRDDTWGAIQSARQDTPEIVALRLSRNFGKEGAIAAGLDQATGDACIVLDADLQHPPSLIPEMVRRWRTEDWDVVDAVKADRGEEAASRRLVTRAFYRVAGWLTGHDLQDASDFKLLDRRVVEEWRRFGERATFFRGLVAWLGFRRTRILFEVPRRHAGRSGWSLSSLAS
jgi:polyisoprenyl-phosphate glycosyltransferase